MMLISEIPFGSVSLQNYPRTDISKQYEDLSNETMNSVFDLAQKELGSRLKENLRERFGVTPSSCSVSVNKESLKFSKVKIVYTSDHLFLSTYEIKRYIYDTYAVNAEVIFE